MRGRELAGELTTAKTRLKDLQATANLVPALRADLKDAREQYAAEKALAGALEKEIAKRLRELKDADKDREALQTARRSLERDLDSRDKDLVLARRNVATLQNEKKTLASEAARVRAAAENRFAGIALTGRRVVFLVDMSGSMDLVDENTQAPAKWTEVRNTVARLMRSMPDLEKYQVIVFAEKPTFLFGDDGWQDYEAQSSPERVLRGLAAVKPKGGTNMYAALEAAFRLRAEDWIRSTCCPTACLTSARGWPSRRRATSRRWSATTPSPSTSAARSRPTGTETCRPSRASASTPSASSSRVPTWAPSCGRWPARTTAVSWA